MRAEIKNLNTCLINYDKKWSSIVKNVIKENADIKNENKKLKKKITSIKSITTNNNIGTNL
jgi:regulator of replication initiation timing